MRLLCSLSLVLAACLPAAGATYYVDHTAPDGGNGSQATPWNRLYQANVAAAGDTVYVKASAPYFEQDGTNDCVLRIGSAGSAAAPIVWEGYTTTPGDGGRAEITDAGSVHYGILVAGAHQVIRNFYFHGNDFMARPILGSGIQYVRCDNIKVVGFPSSNNYGIWGYNNWYVDNCDIDGFGTTGGGSGILLGSNSYASNCVIKNVGGFGISSNAQWAAYNCVVSNWGVYGAAGTAGIGISATTTVPLIVIGCTLDGRGRSNVIGIKHSANTTPGFLMVQNSIVYDCPVCVQLGAQRLELCLFNGDIFSPSAGGTVFNNFTGLGRYQQVAPQFVDAVNFDYRLKPGSPGRGRGDGGFDIGAIARPLAPMPLTRRGMQ